MITVQYQSLYLNVNIEKVMESGLFLTFVTRECSGIRNPPYLLLGNGIAEVLNKRGGIILLSETGKILDATNYGFDNLELNLFVKITGKKKSVVLQSIHNKVSEQMNQNRQSTEREEESEYAKADEVNAMERASAPSPPYRHNITPDIIGETHQRQESRQETRPNEEAVNQLIFSTRMDHLARGLHPTVSPALKSLRKEQLFKSR